MTPDERSKARRRIELFLLDGNCQVSRAELAALLKDALDQTDAVEAEIKWLREYIGTCPKCGRLLSVVDAFCGPCHDAAWNREAENEVMERKEKDDE